MIFLRNLTLKMAVGSTDLWSEAKLRRDEVCCSETSVFLYHTAGHYVAEDTSIVSYAMPVAFVFR
jgi:hypothetical protein